MSIQRTSKTLLKCYHLIARSHEEEHGGKEGRCGDKIHEIRQRHTAIDDEKYHEV
jgi:hypothetical protein